LLSCVTDTVEEIERSKIQLTQH